MYKIHAKNELNRHQNRNAASKSLSLKAQPSVCLVQKFVL